MQSLKRSYSSFLYLFRFFMNAFVQLLRDPRKVVKALAARRSSKQAQTFVPSGRCVAWAFNIAGWKREYLQNCFPEFEFRYISFRDTVGRHSSKILAAKGSVFIVWGLQQPEDLESFAAQNKIQVLRMEDGFIRSEGLGSSHVLPYSVCLDQTGIYFDSRVSSDLEVLLSSYDFDADPDLMREAEICLALIRQHKLTKYNEPQTSFAASLYGAKARTRILVVGQVEDDQSVLFGCDRKITNNDVVRLAAQENPGAQIIYKVHPDVLAGKRAELSNPDDISSLALVVREGMSLDDALTGVDRVYTISSLGGLEALFRGVPVTTLGAPFYAGWGLVDARQETPRRTRSLTLQQLFAGAYLKYARYFDPQTGAPSALRDVLDKLALRSMHDAGAQEFQEGVLSGALAQAGPQALSEPGLAEVILFGFPHPPALLRQVMGDAKVHLINKAIKPADFKKQWVPKIRQANAELYVWGGNLPGPLRAHLGVFLSKQIAVEPGFIHQMGIQPDAFSPFFWNLDGIGLSYEVEKETALVHVLGNDPYIEDEALFSQAQRLKSYILDSLRAKAQPVAMEQLRELLGPRTAPRILVLGQPEDHVSVKQAGLKHYSSNDLVVMARTEHPDAQIIYRPDVANEKQKRPGLSNPQAVLGLCTQVPSSANLSVLLDECDHVYTISHIGGFEAVLRGKPVTLLGAPFYGGWGLTEDRQVPPYRTRTLTVDQLFAGACLQYPRMIDPVYKKKVLPAEVTDLWISADTLRTQRSKPGPEEASGAANAEAAPIPTYVIGFSPWKQFIVHWFPEREMTFIDKRIKAKDFFETYKERIIQDPRSEIFVWGFKMEPYLQRFIERFRLKCWFVEDGFIRSVALGATKAPPYSLNLDSRTPYFDATKPSDLECLLASYDFSADPELLKRADRMMERLVQTGLSKYNNSRPVDITQLYGEKDRRRILVIGQVEDDASIEFGCRKKYTNNDVVMIAALENPGAHIIYKPHPDVMNGFRPEQSSPNDVRHICQVLDQDIPLAQAFESIDHVYTITSQAGFEALMRGIKVTTLGGPFYSGWGLTDDRQPNARRVRKLTVREVFAGAYLLYPKYFDPVYRQPITAEEAVDRLVRTREMLAVKQEVVASVPERNIYLFGFPHPPALLRQVMGDAKVHLINKAIKPADFKKQWVPKIRQANAELYVWGGNLPGPLRAHLGVFLSKQIAVEPGFIHQMGIQPDAFSPFFWNLDGIGLSYEVEKETALVHVLGNDPYIEDEALFSQAQRLKSYILDSLRAKAQPVAMEQLRELLGPRTAPRILVLGQPEDHVSVKQAGLKHYSSNDLVVMARTEHPDAQIIYRPDVANEKQKRPGLSNPQAVLGLCTQVPSSANLSVLLDECDHVYTISHIGGFEAVLRGKPVTLLGAPFYGGWGLTEDRQVPPYRTRTLTVDQLFAGACLQYPRMIDPVYKKKVLPAEVTDLWISADTLRTQRSKPGPEEASGAANAEAAPIPTYVIGFSPWKQFIVHWFPEREMTFIDKRIKAKDFFETYKERIIQDPRSEIFVWGFKMEPYLQRFIERFRLKCWFVEDGFIRSVALGATKAPPYSLNLDSRTPYFDATKPSDLECLLASYDFSADPELLKRADRMMERLVQTGLSKYNNSRPVDITQLYGEKDRRRILVIGQVEDDASIEFGCRKKYTNNDVVMIAALENPGAHIIYKPHPDVMNGFRPEQSSPNDVRHICQVLDQDIPLAQAFESIDHVYTITSQAGFEALMRGIKVTTLGGPFYSGWGLTDDRQPNARRVRKLTVREVFAGAYLLYPKYFDPVYRQPITAEEAVDRLVRTREMLAVKQETVADVIDVSQSQDVFAMETVAAVPTANEAGTEGASPLHGAVVEAVVPSKETQNLVRLLAEVQLSLLKIHTHISLDNKREIVEGADPAPDNR